MWAKEEFVKRIPELGWRVKCVRIQDIARQACYRLELVDLYTTLGIKNQAYSPSWLNQVTLYEVTLG